MNCEEEDAAPNKHSDPFNHYHHCPVGQRERALRPAGQEGISFADQVIGSFRNIQFRPGDRDSCLPVEDEGRKGFGDVVGIAVANNRGRLFGDDQLHFRPGTDEGKEAVGFELHFVESEFHGTFI